MTDGAETEEQSERDYEAYRRLLALWMAENPIKTSKLQFLLLTNALLAVGLALNGGLARESWPVCLAGAALSFVWLLSIGRTTLFQKVWQSKLRTLAARHPDDARFGVHTTARALHGVRRANPVLSAYGAVSAKYYLVAAPLLLALVWLAALVFVLFGPGA